MFKNLTIIALLFVTTTSFGQARDTEKEKSIVNGSAAGKKVVKEGDVLINASYGFPFLIGGYLAGLNSGFGGPLVTGLSVKNLNHICAKAEYMVTNKVSIGLEYTYAQVAISYKDDAINSNGIRTVITYNDLLVKQRALINMGIHFGKSAKFDPYLSFGLGYKYLNYKTSNNNIQDITNIIAVYKAIPIAFRTAYGFRYFFHESISVNAEFGIGGPLVQLGLSLKL